MPRPLKRGILGASTIILSKDIDTYAFMCGSNFNETDVMYIMYTYMINERVQRYNVLCIVPFVHQIFNILSKNSFDKKFLSLLT